MYPEFTYDDQSRLLDELVQEVEALANDSNFANISTVEEITWGIMSKIEVPNDAGSGMLTSAMKQYISLPNNGVLKKLAEIALQTLPEDPGAAIYAYCSLLHLYFHYNVQEYAMHDVPDAREVISTFVAMGRKVQSRL
jgi:hypothetical protein